jgi:sulfur carrier protein
MKIELNGRAVEVAPQATVADAVEASGAEARRGVAVAVEGEVVPRSEWESTPLRDGQQVEVLHAVQGG